MNAAKYTEALEENLMGSARHLQEEICFFFQQDNDQKHKV